MEYSKSLDWKNCTNQTYSCPTDWRLLVSWDPHETPWTIKKRYRIEGFREALNVAPSCREMLVSQPADVVLSRSIKIINLQQIFSIITSVIFFLSHKNENFHQVALSYKKKNTYLFIKLIYIQIYRNSMSIYIHVIKFIKFYQGARSSLMNSVGR